MKTLKELLHSSEIIEANVSLEATISSLVSDSRLAHKGTLFVAVKGTQSDGHRFVPEVLARGAIAVVDADYSYKLEKNIVKVSSTRNLLGPIASRYWGVPSSYLQLVGITGTNGKTTTAFLLDQLWSQMGFTAGLIGTVNNKIGEEIVDSNLTTPGPVELQALFHRMVQRKVEVCAMEVSSIALAQARTQGAQFKVAVFTNFSQDHLDYHRTMEEYLSAKLKLFSDYQIPCVVVNIDDAEAERVLNTSKSERKITFSLTNKQADFHIVQSQFKKSGSFAKVKTPTGVYEVSSPLIGAHNLLNILAALCVIHGLGQDLSLAVKSLPSARGAPGRLERAVTGDYYPNIFVDYAHSDDALENVLVALRKLRGESAGKIITVFGCGGDRDKTKRPKMARVACELSDITIITSDNPRTEAPDAILNDIEIGIDKSRTSYYREVDRREAIYLALKLAKPEDIVLIAGKGHENYQIIGTQKHDFDDVRVVRDYYSL